jgi:hypothetical protein
MEGTEFQREGVARDVKAVDSLGNDVSQDDVEQALASPLG